MTVKAVSPAIDTAAAGPQPRARLRLWGWVLQFLISLSLFAIVAATLGGFPLARWELSIGLLLYGLLLVRFPWLWMVAIPALLPVLDLNLWSGRIFFNEFDLLVLTSVAVALLRRETWVKPLGWRKSFWCMLIILVGWQAVTTLRGLLPLQPIDANSFTSFYSHYNSLRLAKGFFLALLLIPLLGQSLARQEQTGKIITIGLILSCLGAALALGWERALFTGLLNFSADYHGTGLFSGAATGGSAAEAHLLLTLPFLLLPFIIWRDKPWVLLLAALACCLGVYAAMITFSRANYPALAVSLTVFALGWAYQIYSLLKPRQRLQFTGNLPRHFWFWSIVVPLLTVLVLWNQFTSNRFADTSEDLQPRFDHWHKALNPGKDDSLLNLGSGKGSFPRIYYWSQADSESAATAEHVQDGSDSYIRLSQGDRKGSLYIRQKFPFQEPGNYQLKVRLRPTEDTSARLLVEFCERLVYKAYKECHWLDIDTHKDSSQWQTFNKSLQLTDFGAAHWYGSRPVEIAILSRGVLQPLDIGTVELFSPSGKQLLQNTDFSRGWDHWVLYSSDRQAWHIKNIFVDAYFEGGWIGLGVFLLLLIALYIKLLRSINKGFKLALAISASIAAAVMVGMFDSLFDEPRITLLFYLLVWVTFTLGAPSLQVSSDAQALTAPNQFPAPQNWAARLQSLTTTALSARYRRRSLLLAGAMVAITFYLIADRYVAHRHWMNPWNTLFGQSDNIGYSDQPGLTSELKNSGYPGTIYLDGEAVTSLAQAFDAAQDGSIIQLGAGIFNEAATLEANNVQILAEPGAVVFGKATADKAALLILGNNTFISGLECHSIAVRNDNGVCVRLEGSGLTLDNVYFHHSQGGLLGAGGGDIVVQNSRFEDMGDGAFFHSIYALSGVNSLKVHNTVLLNTHTEGHEIKSRARHTEITSSIVAAPTSRDSRLVDIPNGGNLVLKNNVFIEGPNSENADLFSWGVEGFKHQGGILIEDNLIISDKPFANLIAVKSNPAFKLIENNIVIGRILGIDSAANITFPNRKAAGLAPAPAIPHLDKYNR
ncbi:MAG: hypothetical protein GYB33_18865 [Gammaproteobacteria bacterium]|nr:hypothetical protein [Gammaproteobacteria bacterium]